MTLKSEVQILLPEPSKWSDSTCGKCTGLISQRLQFESVPTTILHLQARGAHTDVHWTDNPEIESSNLSPSTNLQGLLVYGLHIQSPKLREWFNSTWSHHADAAQRIEQVPLKHQCEGSNPFICSKWRHRTVWESTCLKSEQWSRFKSCCRHQWRMV